MLLTTQKDKQPDIMCLLKKENTTTYSLVKEINQFKSNVQAQNSDYGKIYSKMARILLQSNYKEKKYNRRGN